MTGGVLTVAALLLAASGCAEKAAPAAVREFTDGMGRRVALKGAPARVVSLAPNLTEIIFELGAGGMLVGVSSNSDHPEAAGRVEKVGEEMNPSIERIVRLDPDIVFTAYSINRRETVADLDRVLGPVVYVTREMSLDGLYGTMTGIGEALGRPGEAAAAVSTMKERFRGVRERTGKLPRPGLLLVIWPSPLVAAGPGTFIDEVIRAAGCRNVLDDRDEPNVQLTDEGLVRLSPEVVAVAGHGVVQPGGAGWLAALGSIPAVKNRRIFFIDQDIILRPGPRLAEAAEQLARMVHPEAY